MSGWMRRDQTLQIEEARHIYARHVAALSGIDCESGIGREIVIALETIPRERFLEPPPWDIFSAEGQSCGVSADPAGLYKDVLVSLNSRKGLNNGQPSLHAFCLHALAPKKGDRAIHVGAGTGYFTAILAALVGKDGYVDAYEIETDLAQRAKVALSCYSQVGVHARSGAEKPLPGCDVIYVSAACAEPLGVWLDALCCGGRLLFPLEPEGLSGQMLLLTKQSDELYAARFLCGVQFVACIGAQDPQAARELETAFRRRAWAVVRSLYRNDSPDETCWCAGRGWWLSTREITG